MGTILASVILGKAGIILQDVTPTRWPTAELLGWLTTGEREIVKLNAPAYTVATNLSLVAGTKQSVPSGTLALVDVIRNMGAGGTTPGQAIRVIDKKWMNIAVPDWHTHTGNAVVQFVMYDPEAPSIYWVYPQQLAATTQQIEASVVKAPAAFTADSEAIHLDDLYEPALLNFVVSKALAKDSKAGNVAKSGGFYSLFLALAGVQQQPAAEGAPAE